MLTRNKILSVLKCKIIDVILEENNFQVLQRAIVIFPYNIFLQPNKEEEKSVLVRECTNRNYVLYNISLNLFGIFGFREKKYHKFWTIFSLVQYSRAKIKELY